MDQYTVFAGGYPAEPGPVDPTNAGASGAGGLVNQGWTKATDYASRSFDSAKSLIDTMQGNAASLAALPTVSAQLAGISRTVGGYVAPAVPNLPTNMAFIAPAAPAEPTMIDVAALDVGQAPTFVGAAPAVDMNIPAPAALAVTVPAAPALPGIAMPVAPAIPLPAVPNLLGISVPVAPLLSLPSFSGIAANSPQAAAYTFSFTEQAYTSDLLTSMRTQLSAWVNGAATGLSAAVEDALWNRGRAREIVNAGRKAKEVLRNFAARGFAKPPGALATQLAEASQEAANASSTLNRDITIEQAKLEQENRRFAFEEAFKVESMLVTYQNQIAQRAWESAHYAQEAAIALYNARVQHYSADIQKYAGQVEQWKEAIAAELTKLDTFKTNIEAARLTGTINEQAINIYRTQVDAAKTVIDVFRAQVEAANTQASINKTQIEAYGAQVNAYGETVRAKASEYESYATRVRAEVSKVEGFKAQTEAYAAQVSGFRALVEAKVAAKNMEIKINRDVPLDLFKMRTEVFKTLTGAEASRVGAVADVYGKNVQAYDAQVRGQTGRMSAEAEAYNSEVTYQRAVADTVITVAKANLDAVIQKTGMLIEATKAGAQTSAQLAASALSAVNLSGSISASTSASQSNGYSRTVGFSYGHNASVGNSFTQSENHNFTNA